MHLQICMWILQIGCWNSWKEIEKKNLAGCWKVTIAIVEFEKVGIVEFEKK